ncbi:MAG: DUF1330 domain-containing protein [Pseudomonadota bacterium]
MHIDPEPAQIAALQALPGAAPVEMLNLIRLRDRAAYPDDSPDAGATGAQAYATYQNDIGPVFARSGGRIVWQGHPRLVLIGPDRWDIAFVASYPSLDAFVKMLADPSYRAVAHHRRAALEDSRLIALTDTHTG